MNLLEIKNLTTAFHTSQGMVRAVDDVSFSIKPGETLALVGESGCGKSTVAYSILRLISEPGKIESGKIILSNCTGGVASPSASTDLLKISEKEICSIRGNRIAMIFQEPMTSLNPVFTIGDQIAEAVILHQKVSKKEGRNRAIEMLKKVGISNPENRVDDYPHQMSGGMRQRVMIAMALSCNPSLLIADEPTTALDVTIQAQILDLMQKLKEEMNMAILLITHDLGVVAEYAERVAVMYAGEIVEEAPVGDLFTNKHHPYTRGLLASIPSLKGRKEEKLRTIPGHVPNLLHLHPSGASPKGCRFAERCERVQDRCQKENPNLETQGTEKVRCFHPY